MAGKMKIGLSGLMLIIIIFLLFSQSSYSAAPPAPSYSSPNYSPVLSEINREPSLQVDSYHGHPEISNPYLQSRIVAMGEGEASPLIGPGSVSSVWNLAVREGEGRLEFRKPQETEWSPIWQAKLLRDGDIVRTGPNGYVKVVLPDQSWVVFGPNTVVDFNLIQMSNQLLSVRLRVTVGNIMTSANKFLGKDPNYEIITTDGGASARGTEFEVYTDGNKTITTVYEGKVELTNFYDNSTIILQTNEQAIIEKEKKTTVIAFLDEEPLTVKISEPCLNTYSYSTLESDPITTNMFEGVKQDYFICLEKEPRPTYTFFTNKFLDHQAINEHNLQFIDGENNLIKGLYDVSGGSTFTFTPNAPLVGKVTIILKGGKEGICSKTKICLEQNLNFNINGLEPSVEWDNDVHFEFIAAEPVLITKKIQIINEEQVTKKNINLTTLSFKSFPPNTYFFIYNISSPVPYEIIKGENDLIKFRISELKPQETLNINLTYATMLFGADYFSRLNVKKINTNYDPAFLKMFTRAGTGIEVEDPKIKELAQKIVGEEKNPFWKAYKIYKWITSTITYDYGKEARIDKGEILETGALLTLQTKKGICDDYTKLFLALARASGIPSRFVTLYVLQEKAEPHAFPEIYLPPYGWIPLDPTWGTNFDAFARTEPGLVILAKEDGLTENHHLNYVLEGEDVQGIVMLSSIDVKMLLLGKEEDWDYFFRNRFFLDIYELTFLSQINNKLSVLESYNQGIGQQLFTLAEKPQTSAVVTAQQALEAYQNGNYHQIRLEVQGVIAKQLKTALTSFSLLAQKSQEYMESPYSDDSILLYQAKFKEGEISPTKTEVLQQINQTKKEMNLVEEQAQAGNYYTAVNSLMSSYFSTLGMYSRLIGDIVSSKIKTIIYSPENIFRFNRGSVVFFGMILIFFILLPFFWLWMLINCLLKKEFRHLNKIIWFLIVFFAYILGAVIYFFVEYRKRKAFVENNTITTKKKVITTRKGSSK